MLSDSQAAQQSTLGIRITIDDRAQLATVGIGPILAGVMSPSMASSDGEAGRPQWLATTHWTVVLVASHESSVGAQAKPPARLTA
jgi:hypothetical protein